MENIVIFTDELMWYDPPTNPHPMKRSILIALVLTTIGTMTLPAGAQSKNENFRIVGYYPLRSALTADPATVPFDRVTHINLSFLNPDTTGVFTQDLSGLAPFVEAAHRKGVKVLASIAGGGRHEYYHALLRDDRRARLINDLLLIALNYNLDGIDVDIEGSDIDENYEKFVVGLASVLKPHNKLVTAAIAVFYKDQFTDRALAQYDFVNLMSYDHTGPWTPTKQGPHSTYEHAVADLDYFLNERNIPKEKMTLGVGFYGYGFGPEIDSPAKTMVFRDIQDQFPGSEQTDELKLPDGATLYYNGIPTIKRKTALARERASGIMIWQLLQDAPGKHSLLRAINEEAYRQ